MVISVSAYGSMEGNNKPYNIYKKKSSIIKASVLIYLKIHILHILECYIISNVVIIHQQIMIWHNKL